MFKECKGRRFLVTGASGFLGRAVCQQLLDSGAEVYGTSRTTVQCRSGQWQHFAVDLADAREVDGLFERAKPDYVIHLAGCVTGQREIAWVREMFAGNLQSALNVLLAAEGAVVSRILLAGSLEEPDQENQTDAVPASPYAVSKWCASAYGRMMHALYGLNVAVARISMAYGPGQNDLRKLIPYVCLSAIRGEAPKLMGGGRPVDWIFLDDVVEGLIRLTICGPSDGSYVDLGSGDLVTTGEVANMICTIAGTGVKPEIGALPDRPMEHLRKANTAGTEALLGWTAKTELSTGLEQTYRWYEIASQDPGFFESNTP